MLVTLISGTTRVTLNERVLEENNKEVTSGETARNGVPGVTGRQFLASLTTCLPKVNIATRVTHMGDRVCVCSLR
jgi:hypothetical protein